jgi:hypothetical protein
LSDSLPSCFALYYLDHRILRTFQRLDSFVGNPGVLRPVDSSKPFQVFEGFGSILWILSILWLPLTSWDPFPESHVGFFGKSCGFFLYSLDPLDPPFSLIQAFCGSFDPCRILVRSLQRLELFFEGFGSILWIRSIVCLPLGSFGFFGKSCGFFLDSLGPLRAFRSSKA